MLLESSHIHSFWLGQDRIQSQSCLEKSLNCFADSRVDSEIMQEALQPLLEAGALQQVLAIFKLVARLHMSGAPVDRRAESHLLELLLVTTSASPAITAALRDENPRECSLTVSQPLLVKTTHTSGRMFV